MNRRSGEKIEIMKTVRVCVKVHEAIVALLLLLTHACLCLQIEKQEKNIAFTSSIALIFEHFITYYAAIKRDSNVPMELATFGFNVLTSEEGLHGKCNRDVYLHIVYICV